MLEIGNTFMELLLENTSVLEQYMVVYYLCEKGLKSSKVL